MKITPEKIVELRAKREAVATGSPLEASHAAQAIVNALPDLLTEIEALWKMRKRVEKVCNARENECCGSTWRCVDRMGDRFCHNCLVPMIRAAIAGTEKP